MPQFESITVKGMVCNRCIGVLKQKLIQANFDDVHISLGKIDVLLESAEQMKGLRRIINSLGFDVLVGKEEKLIFRIKQLIDNYLSDREGKGKLSSLLSEALNTNYTQLSSIFTQWEGCTIERYVINKRLERAKQLLNTEEASLTEISFLLGYSSVHHFSRQFKEVVGVNPSEYKHRLQQKMI